MAGTGGFGADPAPRGQRRGWRSRRLAGELKARLPHAAFALVVAGGLLALAPVPARAQDASAVVGPSARTMPGAGQTALATMLAPASVAPAGVVAARAHRTDITVDGRRSGAAFQGIGAISGGGGNSRYLIDYPEPERSQILDYLFTPDYGASLQMLKLEIGGDSNSSDGSEPSIEHTQGVINCNAGYEWWLAEQAVQRNPGIKLYALQWSAPGWTGNRAGTFWTKRDVSYVIDWLNCARSHGLTISYLGGRDEAGYTVHWFEWMRRALDANGYHAVKLVAADEAGSHNWGVTRVLARKRAFRRAVSVVGEHDSCGRKQEHCASPRVARRLHKPLWLAEQGGLNPRKPAGEVRAINRMYVHGHMTALLEWPLVSSMPPGLPSENMGLVTADQPWSGTYTVTNQVWATAQTTQFTGPGWRHAGRANKMLGNSGSVDTYLSPDHTDWTMVAENTGSRPGQKIKPQTVKVTVRGGLNAGVVHVWATNLDATDSSQWFARQPDILPARGHFSYTIPAGYVVTFTTTTGQSKAGGHAPSVPPPGYLPLPYASTLTSGDGSDEVRYLATLDGAFGFVPCLGGRRGSCLQQLTPQTPVLWHSQRIDYPYAVIGDPSWSNYVVGVDVLLTQPSGTAGVIGRFTKRASRMTTRRVGNSVGLFKGYILDVSENGTWKILRNRVSSARRPKLLASGQVAPLGVDTWHRLSLSLNGDVITAYLDGSQLGSAVNSSYTGGLAGLEAGAFTGTWPIDQYQDLSVTPLG